MSVRAENLENLSQDYFELVQFIEQGREDMAALHLRRLRQAYAWCEKRLAIFRAMVITRVAMKNMSRELEDCFIDAENSEDPFLMAEGFFTRGLQRFTQSRFQEGAKDFAQASKLFAQMDLGDRKLLSDFNTSVGNINARNNGFYESDLTDFNRLERAAKKTKNEKIVGLCLRQRSYILQSLKRYPQAYSDAVKSLRYLCGMAPRSDVALAKLQAADCAIDMERKDLAQEMLKEIGDIVDSRVALPLAYIKARLDDNWENFDLRSFAVRTPFWIEKLKKASKLESLNQQCTSALSIPFPIRADIKTQSLEGKLLAILNQGRCPKKALIARLWPEQSPVGLLDNRLHRLISRLNKKLQGMIEFDGEAYRMKNAISHINTLR